jgi:FkbM family methyltransferase
MKKDIKIGFLVTFFESSNEGLELLKKNLKILSKENYYLVLATHSSVDKEIQELCDFYIYQKLNIVDDRKYSHGVAESNLIELGLNHLREQNIEWTYKICYEIEINNIKVFDEWIKNYEYGFVSCQWGDVSLATNSFFANINFLLNNITFYRDIESMFKVSNVLEVCWEQDLFNRGLLHRIFTYPSKEDFFKENRMDILFYDYKKLDFTFSSEDCRFYITNNSSEDIITDLMIYDYYTDLSIYHTSKMKLPKNITMWIAPFQMDKIILQNKNGYYIEFYTECRTIRRNTLIKDYNFKYPFHKKFESFKREGGSFLEFIDLTEFNLYKNYNININDIKTFVDMGANFGLVSLPFIKQNTKVYLIEPDSRALKALNGNYAHYGNVNIIPKAISGVNGIISFYENKETSPTSTIEKINNKESEYIEHKVDSITPDVLFGEYIKENKIDLLKIDIEGAEYTFFETISDSNLNKIEKFIIEVHFNTNFKIMKILEKLTKNDFNFKLYKWDTMDYNDVEYLVENNMVIVYAWK